MQTQLGDVRKGKLIENVLGFGRALRRAGVPIDSSKIALALQAMTLINVDHQEECKSALFSTLIHEKHDQAIFLELFDIYFKNPDLANKLLGQMLPRTEEKKSQNNHRAKDALQALSSRSANPASNEQKIEFDARMTFSDAQRLRYADFNTLSASEYTIVEQLAKKIPVLFPTQASRRYQKNRRGQHLDFRRILQNTTRTHLDLSEIYWKDQKEHYLPLLILVDISGSMERYTRLLLSFLHVASRHHPNVELFSFGTQLTDLKKAFHLSDTDQMLLQMNQQIKDFGSGTQLGKSLDALNTHYSHRLKGKRTVVVMITDALDTGRPEMLENALLNLKKKSKKILWLNPLMRFEHYQAVAQGPALLSKFADKMIATHHLESLHQLSKHFQELMQQESSTKRL